MGSVPMKFHENWCKGEAVMRKKPFYLTPWPFDPEADRAHPWLKGSVPVKFHEDWWKGEAVMHIKPFYLTPCIVTLTFDLLNLKSQDPSLTHGECAYEVSWELVQRGSSYAQKTILPNPMHCDLDLWPFDPKVYRTHPWLMGSVPVKFHDDRYKGEAVMLHEFILPNLCIVTLTFDLLTPRSTGPILDSRGVCLWSFMRIGVKGEAVMRMKPFYLTMRLQTDGQTDGRTDRTDRVIPVYPP